MPPGGRARSLKHPERRIFPPVSCATAPRKEEVPRMCAQRAPDGEYNTATIAGALDIMPTLIKDGRRSLCWTEGVQLFKFVADGRIFYI